MKVDFPRSGDARDADADRFPGVRQAAFDDLLRLRVVRRVVGLSMSVMACERVVMLPARMPSTYWSVESFGFLRRVK